MCHANDLLGLPIENGMIDEVRGSINAKFWVTQDRHTLYALYPVVYDLSPNGSIHSNEVGVLYYHLNMRRTQAGFWRVVRDESLPFVVVMVVLILGPVVLLAGITSSQYHPPFSSRLFTGTEIQRRWGG